MNRKLMSKFVLMAAIASQVNIASASNWRHEYVDNIHKCKDIIVYNNVSGASMGAEIEWEYRFADGSSTTGSTRFHQVNGGSSMQAAAVNAFNIGKCSQMRYTVRTLNARAWQLR